MNGNVAFFDELSVDTFSRLKLDTVPSHIGAHLHIGFIYRKPGAMLESKLDRILGDVEAYEFGKHATARMDRTGEI